jgi:hypothetical protein
MRLRSITPVVLMLAAVFAPVAARAQEAWDPARYQQLVEEGNALYEQAEARDSSAEYRVSSIRRWPSNSRPRDAGDAVIRNEIADWRTCEAVIQDLFNLNENVLVLLMELDQCAAAELLLDRSMRDEELLPAGGLEHLTAVRDTDLAECQVRASQTQATWDLERFLTLVEQGDHWREQAASVQDPTSLASNLFESAEAYTQALEYLRIGLTEGMIRDNEAEAQRHIRSSRRFATVLLQMDPATC